MFFKTSIWLFQNECKFIFYYQIKKNRNDTFLKNKYLNITARLEKSLIEKKLQYEKIGFPVKRMK